MASLGRKVHGAGDTTRYVIEYEQWLLEGESLKQTGFSVELDPDETDVVDVVITDVVVTPSNEIVFLLAGGSANEVFTVEVQATNSRNEIKNDTIEFFIAAP